MIESQPCQRKPQCASAHHAWLDRPPQLRSIVDAPDAAVLARMSYVALSAAQLRLT